MIVVVQLLSYPVTVQRVDKSLDGPRAVLICWVEVVVDFVAATKSTKPDLFVGSLLNVLQLAESILKGFYVRVALDDTLVSYQFLMHQILYQIYLQMLIPRKVNKNHTTTEMPRAQKPNLSFQVKLF